jgi:hypothetical protein
MVLILYYSYQSEAVPVMFARLEALEKFDKNIKDNPKRITRLTLILLDEIAKQARKVCLQPLRFFQEYMLHLNQYVRNDVVFPRLHG